MYRCKDLIIGDLIGKQFTGLTLCAIPERRMNETISYKNLQMTIPENAIPLKVLSFPDRFSTGYYRLLYYEFIADQKVLF